MFDGLFDDVKSSTKLSLLIGVMCGVAIQFPVVMIVVIVVMVAWQLYGAFVAAFRSRLLWLTAMYLMHALTLLLVWPASRAESWREAMPWVATGCCVYLATHVLLKRQTEEKQVISRGFEGAGRRFFRRSLFHRWLPMASGGTVKDRRSTSQDRPGIPMIWIVGAILALVVVFGVSRAEVDRLRTNAVTANCLVQTLASLRAFTAMYEGFPDDLEELGVPAECEFGEERALRYERFEQGLMLGVFRHYASREELLERFCHGDGRTVVYSRGLGGGGVCLRDEWLAGSTGGELR